MPIYQLRESSWDTRPADPDHEFAEPNEMHLLATAFPTCREMRESLAMATADTVLQILHGDAVYAGLGQFQRALTPVKGTNPRGPRPQGQRNSRRNREVTE